MLRFRAMPPHCALVGVALATLLTASACTSKRGTGESSAAASATFRVGSAGGFATYESVNQNKDFVTAATEELTRRCMEFAGFKYWPVPSLPKEFRNPARPLTLVDAEARGYRALEVPLDAPGSAESNAYLASLTASERAAYQLAVGGNPNRVTKMNTPVGQLSLPTEGCLHGSVAKLITDPEQFQALLFTVSNLTQLHEFRPDVDPNLVTATSEWARCITGSGYDYKTPGAAQSAAMELDSSSPNPDGSLPRVPTPKALAIAVADATCRSKTSWDSSNAAAVRNALAVVVDAHQADILAFNELALAAADKARTVLAG